MEECFDYDNCNHTATESEQTPDEERSSHFVYEQDEANKNTQESELSANKEIDVQEGTPLVAEDFTLISTYFQDGPLGVNLHRRVADGIVEVTEIFPNSQAIHMDVKVGDEVWSIGTIEVGKQHLDKEAWEGLVDYIKQGARPIQVVWNRRKRTESFDVASLRSTSRDARQLSHSGSASPTEKLHAIYTEPTHVEAAQEEEEEETEEIEISPTYRILESVLSNLIKKSPNGKEHSKEEFPYRYLLKEDRRLLRRGELTTQGVPTLWMKTYLKKHVILLSDILIITSPQMVHKTQCYLVEHIIDLQACKLRSDGQVFGGSLEGKGGASGNGGMQSPTAHKNVDKDSSNKQALEAAFEIIWPGGSLQLFADSKESKEVWVLNLFLAICARVGGETNGKDQVLGWRHQYMLGTMHSAVLSHDESRVRELVALCDAGEMEFSTCIDAMDEDGYTPLHYACIKRMHGIIRALHEAAADVTAQDHRGLTPLHWAAMQLDDYTLSLLCSHVFDLDLLDKRNRSPLYMACVEGRDIAGHTDNAALKRCVACMLTHQPNVNFYDEHGYTMVHYLAASWQFEALELLLQAGADVNARCAKTGMTALHLACMASPIKLAEGEAKQIIQGSGSSDAAGTGASGAAVQGSGINVTASPYEKLNHPFGATTLRTLLKAGARPNAKDGKGRTALHILAEPGRDDLWDLMELTDGVAVLVSFGARFDDTGALSGLKSRMLGINVDALVERWASLPVINGDALNITLNHFNPNNELAASKISHNSSADSGSKKGAVSPTPSVTTSSKNKSAAATQAHSAAPVFAENTNQCSLCLFQFSLFRRPHHCRVCDALTCDECSKKRCLVEYSQARTCDSCYNRIMDLQEKKNREDMLGKMKPIPKSNSNASKLYLENRNKLLAEAQAGGGEEKTDEKGRRGNNTSQTMNVLGETHEKLLERGEKLSKLSERSDLLANQANDFAKMAKALNEQQKSRWF